MEALTQERNSLAAALAGAQAEAASAAGTAKKLAAEKSSLAAQLGSSAGDIDTLQVWCYVSVCRGEEAMRMLQVEQESVCVWGGMLCKRFPFQMCVMPRLAFQAVSSPAHVKCGTRASHTSTCLHHLTIYRRS